MRIKKIREDKGLTQVQLAKSLGIGSSTFSRYESGEVSPSPEMLSKIAVALGVDVNMLFDDTSASDYISISELQIRIIDNILKQPKEKLQEILKFIQKLK